MLNSIRVTFFVSIIVFMSCSGQKTERPGERILVAFSSQKITIDDFERAYEFSLPHLKTGKDLKERKLNFLNSMINERLLAMEGYHLGFNKSAKVKKLTNDLSKKLMVEAVYRMDVFNKIKITNDEIRDAINKSKVQFKFRYWFEPTMERAQNAASRMRVQGYADVVENILQNNAELKLEPDLFESDYLTWLDINPGILNAIKDISIGDISDPVKISDVYFIFQLLDIRKDYLAEIEYLQKDKTYRTILFHQQLQKETIKYIEEFMTPKHVITKRSALILLGNALAQWRSADSLRKMNFLDAVNNDSKSNTDFQKLKNNFNKTLVEYNAGILSIKELIEILELKKITADPTDSNQFLHELNNTIAITLRDFFLLEEAKRRNLDKSPWIQSELKRWKDKWVYNEIKNYILKELKTDLGLAEKYFINSMTSQILEPDSANSESHKLVHAYFLELKNKIQYKADSLRHIFNVKIDYALLDSAKVSESKKSRWMGVQIYHAGTGRPLFPPLDALWGL